MRNFKYILIVAASLFAACTAEIFEEPVNKYDGTVQIVGRVIPFADCDVDTRANKNDSEIAVTSVDYFIFNQNDICIFHGRMDNSDAISIDKKQISTNHGDISNCYIVTIANTNGYNVTEGTTTWATLEQQTEAVTGVQIPENGLPMFGRHPEGNGYFNLGEVESGQLLTVPMVSLYSKIVVNISVDADQVLSGENQPVPTFQLTGCEVHNVASGVDFIGGTESHDGANNGNTDDVSVSSTSYTVDASGETLDGGTQISFSFYLPERFVKSKTSANEFTYPFGKGANIREEDMNYRQRYKPMLAKGHNAYNSTYVEANDKKATYATISGIFSDHQGHSFNVSYDIYIGNDNYSNFDIVRNRQYNNNIIIQGISNSSDQSTDQGAISIDHRVNVERLDPIIVNFRRETLLDSHFEVRPLRIRKNPQYTGNLTNAKVKVEVEYAVTPTSNWIGLERGFGNGKAPSSSTTYLLEGELADDRKNSAGKRKYFTTDLTTNTLNTAAGKTVIVPVTEAEECIWIYVDECTTADDDVRTATIKVSYALDGTNYSKPVSYVINQRELFPVTYNGHTYHIEYHEEYLHNYDSEDQFGQTHQDGMVWGLNNIQISHIDDAVVLGQSTGVAGWFNQEDAYTEALNKLEDSPKYDFYLIRDTDNTNLEGKEHDFSGYSFNQNISAYLKANYSSNSEAKIEGITLAEDPKSAFAYCYNRNKRNEQGLVVSQNWYLPAIDEIEEIVIAEYATYFPEFQNNMYWSCQPAFDIVNMSLTVTWGGSGNFGTTSAVYYRDDQDRARATKVDYLGKDSNGNDIIDVPLSSSPGFVGTQYGTVKATLLFGNTVELGSFTTQEVIFTDEYSGNKSRKDKARVRCIRRVQEQN